MTVDRAVLNLNNRDFAPGLSYVVVSRVKTLQGILFEEPFDFERFHPRPSETVRARMDDYHRRQSEHLQSQDRRMGFGGDNPTWMPSSP